MEGLGKLGGLEGTRGLKAWILNSDWNNSFALARSTAISFALRPVGTLERLTSLGSWKAAKAWKAWRGLEVEGLEGLGELDLDGARGLDAWILDIEHWKVHISHARPQDGSADFKRHLAPSWRQNGAQKHSSAS